MEEMVRFLRALVLLQLNPTIGESVRAKPELLLLQAGFPRKEIAALLGKSEAAVSKTIERAQGKRPNNDEGNNDG